MSRQPIPLLADDISSFTRALAHQLKDESEPPSHLGLMNMLSRAAGFRNYQHLRAAHQAGARIAAAGPPEPIDHRLVERALFQFDDTGRLRQWPSRRSVQELCLWALWARLPVGITLHERDINVMLDRAHCFADAALLRRSLIGLGLATRKPDGSDYRRVEQRPPSEARELIRLLEARREG